MSVTSSLQKLCLRKEDLGRLPDGWLASTLEEASVTLPPGKLYDEKSALPEGEIPVLNQTASEYHGYHNEAPGVVASPEKPVFTFANHTCEMRLMTQPYSSIQNIFSRVGKPEFTDTIFLYYATLGRVVQDAYKGHHPIYRSQWVPIPPYSTQTEIVNVLYSYDTLIANNRRRIELLERAARMIYKEWFVRFRFPGHEHVKIKNGIPEGWKRVKIGDKFVTILGGTPSRKKIEYWTDGTIPWINSGAINSLRIVSPSELITEKALEESAAKMMPKRTTLLAITGATLGQVSLSEIECCANQSVVGIYDQTGIANEYIYLCIKEEIRSLVVLAGGGAQQHINKEIVNSKIISLPDDNLLLEFSAYSSSLFDQISVLLFENESLSKARDILLPRLMNGTIQV